MAYLFSLVILVFSLNANALDTYTFFDYSGDSNELKLHPAGEAYWLDLAGLSLINLNKMDLGFAGLEFYQTEHFFRDPSDDAAIGNIFEEIKLILRRSDNPEFVRALTMFRELVEGLFSNDQTTMTPDQFCPWDADAILIIKLAADDAGNAGSRMPFCLKLEN